MSRIDKLFTKENVGFFQEFTERDHGDIHAEIIKFLTANPRPSEDEFDKFAENLGIDDDKLQEHTFMILGDILTEGRSKDFTGSYDPEQIRMGIEVEYEHTTIPQIAEKIARDHLAEFPDYYTRLEKMEEEGKRDHGISEAFAKLVKSTVKKGRRVPVRSVARRVKRRAVKRYAKYQAREQSKK